MNNELAYNFSYLILHGACNQKSLPLPAEINDLLHTLLVSFNRISEDYSLTFKPRLSKYRILKGGEVRDHFASEEEIHDKIDSNILYALLAYCSRSKEHIDKFF